MSSGLPFLGSKNSEGLDDKPLVAMMRRIVLEMNRGYHVGSAPVEAHRLRFLVRQYRIMRDADDDSRKAICRKYGLSLPEMGALTAKQYHRWKAAVEGGPMAIRSAEKATRFA